MTVMSQPTPDFPGELVLLGDEGLRADSIPVWNRIAQRVSGSLQKLVVIPAALTEKKIGTVDRHARLASEFLDDLGVNVHVVRILSRNDAADKVNLRLIDEATAYYLLGGEPRFLPQVLWDTPAWDSIQQHYAEGIPLIVSGGATVALGATGITPRQPYPTGVSELEFDTFFGLGVLKDTVILPYLSWLPDSIIEQIEGICPPGSHLLGLDTQVALIRHDGKWHSEGQGSISLFNVDGTHQTVSAGQSIPVDWTPLL